MSDQTPLPQQPDEPQAPKKKRRILLAAGAAIVAVGATVGGLAATGAFSSPQPFTVHGQVENSDEWSMDNTTGNTWVADSNHPGKCLDSETISVMATVGGRDVTVASGQLANGDGTETIGTCWTSFTIPHVPGGYASYGFQIKGVPGTVNMTRAQIAKGAGLRHRGLHRQATRRR